MTEPTDAELEALIAANLLVVEGGQCAFESRADIRPELVKFARAVLAKWGTPPAVAGTPVGEVHHLHELNDEWLSKLPIGTKLYTTPQPTQAQAGAVPMTDEQKHARNPYRHSRGAASVWMAGFEAAELWYRIGIKGGQHG